MKEEIKNKVLQESSEVKKEEAKKRSNKLNVIKRLEIKLKIFLPIKESDSDKSVRLRSRKMQKKRKKMQKNNYL